MTGATSTCSIATPWPRAVTSTSTLKFHLAKRPFEGPLGFFDETFDVPGTLGGMTSRSRACPTFLTPSHATHHIYPLMTTNAADMFVFVSIELTRHTDRHLAHRPAGPGLGHRCHKHVPPRRRRITLHIHVRAKASRLWLHPVYHGSAW